MKKSKQMISVVLSLLMILSLLPISSIISFAAEGDYEYTLDGGSVRITAYKGNNANVVVPDSLEGHSIYAITSFGENSTVKSVKLSKSIKVISEFAFSECINLESVTFNDGLEEIDACAFSNTKLKEVVIPSSVKSMYSWNGYVYASAFVDASLLSKVTFSEGMTKIPKGALKECVNIETVVLPSTVTSIEEVAFCNCSSLKNINLPENIITIFDDAFYNCSSLAELKFPENLQLIYQGAFQNCSALTAIKFSENVKTIGIFAFADCTKLANVVFNDGLEEIGACAFSNTKLKEVVIPGSVKSMYSWNGYVYASAFADVSLLSKVTFSEGITKIPKGALKECVSIETVILPSTVTSIEEVAFCNCSSLANINLPENIITIFDNAFYNCSSLTELELPKDLQLIYQGAFQNCSALSEIEIPENVKTIGKFAFAGCTKLANVVFNEGLEEIGSEAFSGTVIKEVVIPGTIKSMYSWNGYAYTSAFLGASLLSKVTFSEGVTEIPKWALENCNSVKEVVISDSVTSIGDGAFVGTNLLKNVYGYTGSYAEIFANENSYNFISLGISPSLVKGLDDLIAKADELDKNKYTSETVKFLDDAVENGKVVTENEASTAEDYSNAIKEIEAAFEGLVIDVNYVPTPDIMLGDINNDGKTTVVDAKWILQAVANARDLTDEQRAIADVNGDGKVTVVDAKWILQAVAGMRDLNK